MWRAFIPQDFTATPNTWGVKQSICSRKYCCRYFVHSQYFEVLYSYFRYYCVYFRACTNSGSATAAVVDTPYCASSISALCTAGTANNIHSLAVFRPLLVFVLLLRVLAVPKYPQYVQYTSRMKYTSTVCEPCLQFSGPLFGKKHSQIVPRVGVGANYFNWGQLEYLEHWQCISRCALRGICTSNTLSFSRFRTADIACTPSVSCYDAAGTYMPVLSELGTAHTLTTLSI